MASIDAGAEVFRNRARNCRPWVRSFVHSPEAVTHSPAEIIAAWPTVVTRSAMATRLEPQNAEAVFRFVEGDPLDKARENFGPGVCVLTHATTAG